MNYINKIKNLTKYLKEYSKIISPNFTFTEEYVGNYKTHHVNTLTNLYVKNHDIDIIENYNDNYIVVSEPVIVYPDIYDDYIWVTSEDNKYVRCKFNPTAKTIEIWAVKWKKEKIKITINSRSGFRDYIYTHIKPYINLNVFDVNNNKIDNDNPIILYHTRNDNVNYSVYPNKGKLLYVTLSGKPENTYTLKDITYDTSLIKNAVISNNINSSFYFDLNAVYSVVSGSSYISLNISVKNNLNYEDIVSVKLPVKFSYIDIKSADILNSSNVSIVDKTLSVPYNSDINTYIHVYPEPNYNNIHEYPGCWIPYKYNNNIANIIKIDTTDSDNITYKFDTSNGGIIKIHAIDEGSDIYKVTVSKYNKLDISMNIKISVMPQIEDFRIVNNDSVDSSTGEKLNVTWDMVNNTGNLAECSKLVNSNPVVSLGIIPLDNDGKVIENYAAPTISWSIFNEENITDLIYEDKDENNNIVYAGISSLNFSDDGVEYAKTTDDNIVSVDSSGNVTGYISSSIINYYPIVAATITSKTGIKLVRYAKINIIKN